MKHSDYLASLEHDPLFQKGLKSFRLKFALSDAVLKARLDHNWSQAELAKRVGTRQANISRIEAGNANPTLDLIHRLVEVLDINIIFAPGGEARASAIWDQVYNDYSGIPVDWSSRSTKTSIAVTRNFAGYQIAPKTDGLNVR